MSLHPIGRFYDSLAETYHLVRPGWEESVLRQGAVLHALALAHLGPGLLDVLDCTCGIGTQALGLAGEGHDVVGVDISAESVARARREAGARGLPARFLAGDMRALPLRASSFDVVVSGDNAVAHLATDTDLLAALRAMRRVLRPRGLLVITLHTYERGRPPRHQHTDPQMTSTPDGPAVGFQRWRWHEDGERYDFENIRVLPDGAGWRLEVLRTTLRALTREQITRAAGRAGFRDLAWLEPQDTGFFQPIFVGRPAT